jgi:hypothetical protein
MKFWVSLLRLQQMIFKKRAQANRRGHDLERGKVGARLKFLLQHARQQWL